MGIARCSRGVAQLGALGGMGRKVEESRELREAIARGDGPRRCVRLHADAPKKPT